ncbi:MAG: hypothetical protein K9K30_02180 [Burkholderiaceae bacterium]|nr:hypothetical protein [Sulfuritalea sp.]MCF8174023.1 hypothetical protein [Burkholderiaceae bacterium]
MKLNTQTETTQHVSVMATGEANQADADMQIQRTMTEERLPFTVKIVRNEVDLDKAVSIRHMAYERHIPELAAKLDRPEAYDNEPGSVVLLAESKLDGSPLGTMRIQTNRFRKLALEESVELPSWLQGKSQAEATRLGIFNSRVMGRLVKTAIFKAYYQYCLLDEIEWMVITARSPLDRQYAALLFVDAIPGGGYIPMSHVGGIPHRVMALKVGLVEQNWRKAGHPLYNFFFHTSHSDIDLCGIAGQVATGSHFRSTTSLGIS